MVRLLLEAEAELDLAADLEWILQSTRYVLRASKFSSSSEDLLAVVYRVRVLLCSEVFWVLCVRVLYVVLCGFVVVCCLVFASTPRFRSR